MKQAYGLDVTWEAGEVKAFIEYNRLCGEQARAIHRWNVNPIGPRPEGLPAKELAARARATVAESV